MSSGLVEWLLTSSPPDVAALILSLGACAFLAWVQTNHLTNARCTRPRLQILLARFSILPQAFALLFMILFVAKGHVVAHVIIEFTSQFIEAYVIVVFWALYMHLLGGKELALQAYEKPQMASAGNMFWTSSSPVALFNFHKICVWQLMIVRPVLGSIVVAIHKYQASTVVRIFFLVSMVLAMRTLAVMYRGTNASLQQPNGGVGTKFLVFKLFVLIVLIQDSLFAIGIRQGRILPDQLDPDAAGTRVMSMLVVLETILFVAGFWLAYGADDDLIRKAPLRAAPEPIGYLEALSRMFCLWDLFDIDDSSMIAADESGAAALTDAGDSADTSKHTSIVPVEPSAAVEMVGTSSAAQSSSQ